MFKIRNNIEEFSPDIYPYTFWVSADNDMKLINEKFTSYYHDTDQGPLQEPSSTDVLCVYQVLEKKTNKIGALLVVVRKKITCGDIAHEAVHMAKIYQMNLICKAWPDSFEVFNSSDFS